MDPTQTAEVPAPPADEKKGRGPTRKSIAFADLVDDLSGDEEILGALKIGDTAKTAREFAKKLRADAKDMERRAVSADSRAAILARVEELPADLRRALIVVLTPEGK